jgi:hypothetical protein
VSRDLEESFNVQLQGTIEFDQAPKRVMCLKYHPYIVASTLEEEIMERRMRCVAEDLRSLGWFKYERQRHGKLTGAMRISERLRQYFSNVYAHHGPATSGDDTKLSELVEARTILKSIGRASMLNSLKGQLSGCRAGRKFFRSYLREPSLSILRQ